MIKPIIEHTGADNWAYAEQHNYYPINKISMYYYPKDKACICPTYCVAIFRIKPKTK